MTCANNADLSSPLRHGPVLTARVLQFLATARKGATELELRDLLSRDREVREEIRQRFHRSPHAERIPDALWIRLYSDLLPLLLSEQEEDNETLLRFTHPQVRDVVSRFVCADESLDAAHHAWAQYLQGQASLTGDHSRPNLRLLSELPHHELRLGKDGNEITTLTDAAFIQASSMAGRNGDLGEFLAQAVDPSSRLRDALREDLGVYRACLERKHAGAGAIS